VRIGTLDVPRLAIGTIKWIPDGGVGDARLRATFESAVAQGINLFDSAERYGASPFDMVQQAARFVGLPAAGKPLGGSGEVLLGSFAEHASQPPAADGTPAPPLALASKFTPVPWRTSAQSVVDACAASAGRLGVESVDLYQLHMPDIIQPFAAFGLSQVKDELYWDGLAQCYERGLAKNVGVSNYGPSLLSRCQRYLAERGVPLASNQINYSLLYRKQGSQATVDWCRAHDVAVLAYYPLAMGCLTGRWDRDQLPKDQGLAKYFQGDSRAGIPPEGVAPLAAALHAVAAARNRTVAQVSLNWVLTKGAIPVVGATSPEQLTDSAGALGWRLSEEEVLLLEGASDACGFEFQGSGLKTSDSKFVGYAARLSPPPRALLPRPSSSPRRRRAADAMMPTRHARARDCAPALQVWL
jgi:pyridoxine 4-dehydrogenase